jgi:ABC-type glycerol-3-phosphate transport system permease component
VAIFQFQWTWNDFLYPLIYINSQDKKTIALGLQDFYKSQTAVEWQQLMAASVIMVLPVALLFFFLQRYFIEGITLTGLKG